MGIPGKRPFIVFPSFPGPNCVTYSPPSTRRSQRLFWKLMDEAPDAHRELLEVEVDE